MTEDLHSRLGSIEGKLDVVLGYQRSQRADTAKHDDRIRSLEGSRKWLIGAGAVLAVPAAAFAAHLKGIFEQ